MRKYICWTASELETLAERIKQLKVKHPDWSWHRLIDKAQTALVAGRRRKHVYNTNLRKFKPLLDMVGYTLRAESTAPIKTLKVDFSPDLTDVPSSFLLAELRKRKNSGNLPSDAKVPQAQNAGQDVNIPELKAELKDWLIRCAKNLVSHGLYEPNKRLDTLERQLAELTAKVSQPPSDIWDRLNALGERLADHEQTVVSLSATSSQPPSDIWERVSTLERQLPGLTETLRTCVSGLETQVTASREQINRLETQVTADRERVSSLTGRIADAEQLALECINTHAAAPAASLETTEADVRLQDMGICGPSAVADTRPGVTPKKRFLLIGTHPKECWRIQHRLARGIDVEVLFDPNQPSAKFPCHIDHVLVSGHNDCIKRMQAAVEHYGEDKVKRLSTGCVREFTQKIQELCRQE